MALPDVLGALVAYVRESPEVQAVAGGASPRVSATRQSAWPDQTQAVVLSLAGGTSDALMWEPRVDVRCYGTDNRTATDLWRRVDAWLCPDPGGARPEGFVRANTRVYRVSLEGGPNVLQDPAERWPYALATYRPLCGRVPA